MNDDSAERRHFSRILFDAWAELRQGDANLLERELGALSAPSRKS